MPTFTSFNDYAAAIRKLSKQFDAKEMAEITMAMGKKAQAIAEAQARADLGGDPKFSGWAPRLDTQLKSGKDGSTIMSPTKTSAGPWTVANAGRNQGNASGFQGPGVSRKTGLTKRLKSGGLGKVKATQGKRWNGYTVGKHTADKAVKRMEAELPKVAEASVRKVIMRHFDVT